MDLLNTIENKLENFNNFFINNLGNAINNGIDMGLKYLMPDCIENEVIDVKNALISGGLKQGINVAIDSAINIGKNAIDLVTDNFVDMNQVKNVIEKGGLIDLISDVLDKVINSAKESGLINNSVTNILKEGKNILLGNIDNNVNENIENQIKSINKLDKYLDNWNQYYEKHDFSNMEKEFNKIEKQIKEIAPLEEIINKTRKIENLHNLIKNKDGKFDLTEEEKLLAENI